MRALIAFLLLCVALPAFAQQQPKCGPANELRDWLETEFQEAEISGGVSTDEQTFISVYVSPGGDTWSIVINRLDGISCIVSEGKHWMQGTVPVKGEPV